MKIKIEQQEPEVLEIKIYDDYGKHQYSEIICKNNLCSFVMELAQAIQNTIIFLQE